ncbi:MAG: antitoxin [Deltaproteobacteria bacterium]|nr:antitoxin [Deltaproteobacteria bacterium]OQY09406.1 MAG: hypothetical protein B6I30_09890 [Desulfobacteraceae bacterium 4572_187]MBW1959535.1 antitoxin [Deltaproteobacteria bacterium]MBW2013514.1 antitoxin [Deltaproteobacteria bacterium]MBW2089919.1 antitoxin [Deltaproteobacteria bacterium]
MNTKLTLRMDDAVIRKAKMEAKRRGKSVSRMVAEFIESIGTRPDSEKVLPPTTASLVGILKGKEISEDDYKVHLREKYL